MTFHDIVATIAILILTVVFTWFNKALNDEIKKM